MYVEVLTQISAKAVDQYYVYSVPEVFRDYIKIVIRVRIPFGKMELEGFVMNILNGKYSGDIDSDYISNINNIIQNKIIFSRNMITYDGYRYIKEK